MTGTAMTLTGGPTQVEVMASAGPSTEVLIREARQRQRKRHHLIAAVLTALFALVLVILLVAGLNPNGPSGSQVTPPQGSLTSSPEKGLVTIRPIICLAPPYSRAATMTTSRLPTSCSAQYRVSDVTPNSAVQGYSYDGGSNDPALAAYPTTGAAGINQGKLVLLDALTPMGPGNQGSRYLLGPVQFVLNPSADIASASVTHSTPGSPAVQINFTPVGAKKWNATTKSDFHHELAFVFDGKVMSTPIIEPTMSSFVSFGNKGEVDGSLTTSEARQIAAALSS